MNRRSDEVNNEAKVCIAKSELNEECSAEARSEPRVVPSPEWLARHGVRMETVKVRSGGGEKKGDKVAKPERGLKGGDSSVSLKSQGLGGKIQSIGGGAVRLGEGWEW